MDLYRKLLIVIIIILFSYILYRLWIRRIQLYNSLRVHEGFTTYSDKTVNTIQSNNKTTINLQNINIANISSIHGVNPSDALQLSNYCIKSSYNTAYNGSDVSIDMITYVLSRGCRFVDFEVYWGQSSVLGGNTTEKSGTNGAVVSFSNDPMTPACSTIALGDVFKTIMQNAFNSY